jgi:hypothetical protein
MNNYVTHNEQTRVIEIAFDKLFNRDDISHMNNFAINKRSYYNCLDLISNDLNLVLNRYHDLAYSLLEIRYYMLTNKAEYTYMNFYKDIERLFLDNPNLIQVITDIVDEEYTLDLNETSTGKKINVELQVTDELNKVYLKSSILMRILIPLLCDFNSDDDTTESLIYDIFTEIIKRFDGNSTSALNKLYKIIYSRVFQTKYSDVVIWTYLKNMSVDLMIIIKKYYKIIIKNIFPKINHNSSVISYLDVVIKQKLKFLFTYKYPISYKPLKAETTDDEELSEQERMEINLLRNDQGMSIINEMSIMQEISKIKKKYSVTDTEIKEFIDGRQLNSIQIYLVKIFYADKIKINSNKKDIFYLLYGMKRELEDMNFSIIPDILSCSIAQNVRKMNNRKKLVEKVVSSEKYTYLLKSYLPIKNILDKNNVILSLMTIKNSKFLNKEKEEMDFSTEQLAEEVLDLLLYI